MVELDDLKNIWSKNITNDVVKNNLEQEQIRLLLKNKSNDIIEKIRKNVLIEIVLFFVCLCIITMVTIYFNNKEVTVLSGIVIGFIFIPYLFYYIKKYREIKNNLFYHQDIKTNLQNMIVLLQKYLNIYFYGSLLLTPITGVLSGYAILYEMKALGFLLYFDMFNKAVFIGILAFAALLSLLSYPLMKWYIHKLYGQHLEKLKDCLNELNTI